MDVSTLLLRSGRSEPGDYDRKILSLRNGYRIAKLIDTDIDIDRFMKNAVDVIGRKYGGDALDSYITTTMSVIKNFSQDIDIFAASVLNSVVLQMNFQTRIFIDGNQSIIFDGDPEYFAIAMLHGNATQGIRIASEAGMTEVPVWANKSPALEINMSTLHVLPMGEVTKFQAANGTRFTGAILIADPPVDGGAISFTERYAEIAHSLGPDTIYCLTGTAEMVFDVAMQVEKLDPTVDLYIKPYAIRNGRALEYRAALVFSGLDQLPDLVVRPGVTKECTFDYKLSDNGGDLASINYGIRTISGRNNNDGVPDIAAVDGMWENARVRRPFFLSSSAPLPLEARERTSQDQEILHTALRIKDGIMIPVEDPSSSTFVFSSGKGKVVNDHGTDPTGTPFYQSAKVNADGVRRAVMKSDRLVRVTGAAMPLMFTPQLHKWHSHFMIQCLPRIRIIRDMEEDVAILLPHDLRKKQIEMLDLLGFGEDKIVWIQRTDVVQADTLYYPWPWRLAFSEYNSAVYDEIADKVEAYERPTPKRVLISRESRKSWRNLINYDAVRQMLVEEFGFEVISPEKMTLSEEVYTYRNADIVVGAEGAGMYGAVFSRPAAKYITICDEDYVMPILGSLAEVRGFDIGYVFGESFRADKDVNRRLLWGHADFAIDVERLRKAVQTALS